jgi:NAD(P)-dependent dehydrogenase (short-subunit alcohol dehydrogenase family)
LLRELRPVSVKRPHERWREPARKVYVADIDFKRGILVSDEIVSEGFASEFVELDVASPESCVAAAATIHTNDGRLDILVNNAGIGHVGTILETRSEDLDRLYAVNVRGMFDLTKAFIDRMIERRYGVVINVASIGGVIAIRERLAYCTTKFAVVGFTKCLALDHALQGIRANCVCPGPRRDRIRAEADRGISRSRKSLPGNGRLAGDRSHGNT